MQELWSLLNRIAPVQASEITRIVMLLEKIEAGQPIGRRAAASQLSLSEREVRSAAESLRDLGFVDLSAAGMTLTRHGADILPEVKSLCRLVTGLGGLEKELKDRLKLNRVTVVQGDADETPGVLAEVGRYAANWLRQMVRDNMIVAIAGGSTMAQVAKSMIPCASGVMVVPARGGIGSMVAVQADTVASELAGHMHAACRLMHLPDGINTMTLNELLKLPEVKETVAFIRKADMILYGIGRADVMAARRGLQRPQLETLLSLGAVGESMGNFFDSCGRTLYQSPSVSAQLDIDRSGSRTIAAAAGANKAEAILASVRGHVPDCLVVDEGAARGILSLLNTSRSY